MTLKEIVRKIGGLSIYEKRSITDEYVELVFFNKDINEWNKVFVEVFGPPEKEPGVKPNKEVSSLTKSYGGIWKDQTFFKKDSSSTVIIAMFWPWQDRMHTTVKVAVLKKGKR
ncbi:MAG: hypothetical protein JSV34_02975 [Candidatus Omnitrophota bacterium]|nr:MAG: hypothetical protein JSV34_02975 [Candidatus Omnitrophota bacterium]